MRNSIVFGGVYKKEGVFPFSEEISVVNVEDLMDSNVSSIEDVMVPKGKVIVVDGPFIDMSPATNDLEIKEIVKRKVLNAVRQAEMIGAKEIVFLSNYLPMIKVDFYDQDFIDSSIAFWKEMIAQSKRVTIALCNTFEETPDVMLEIYHGVDDERFSLAFDIGHAFLYAKIDLYLFYEKLKDVINVVYIHSNAGVGDEHLSVLEGNLLESASARRVISSLEDVFLIVKTFKQEDILEQVKKILALRKAKLEEPTSI